MLPAGDQDEVEPLRGHHQASSPVLYTPSCKHSLVLLRMGEIIAPNMFSRLKLLIKLLLLHLVSYLYYCINDARLHKHQKWLQMQKADILFQSCNVCVKYMAVLGDYVVVSCAGIS